MSRYYTHTTQYKKLQNDHHTGGVGGGATSTVDTVAHNNNNKIVVGKQHFYQVGQTPKSASSGTGAVASNGSSLAKMAERNSPSAAAMQQTKLSTHLLDHGYGATPQPQQFVREATPSSAKSVAAKDFRITNYYKVRDTNFDKNYI